MLAKYIAKKHNYKKLKDWYKLTWNILVKDGSSELVKIYPDGISFLRKIYPKHEWRPWFFERITGRVWKTKKFQLEYLNWFAKKLGINQVSAIELGVAGGAGIISLEKYKKKSK